MRTWTLLVVALMLAGCTGGDEDAPSSAAVGTDGDMEDTADCPEGDATLTGAGSVDEGTVTITVMDGDGNEVWSETYDDAFELEGEAVEGASGTWTIEATESSGFDGTFGLNMLCS